MMSITVKFASKNLRKALATAAATTDRQDTMADDATTGKEGMAANVEDDKEEVVAGQVDGVGNGVVEKGAEGKGEGEDNGGKEVVGSEVGNMEAEKVAEDKEEGEDDGGKEEVVGGEVGEAKGEDDGGKEEGDDGEADGEEEPELSKQKNGGRRKKIVIEEDKPKHSTHSRTKAEKGPHCSGCKAPDLGPAPVTTCKRGLDNDAMTSASKCCCQ
jgi:hypothetical protein